MRGLALLLLALAAVAQAQQLSIKSAERKINLKTQVVKVTDVIDFAAAGGDAKEALVCYPGRLASRLARMKIVAGRQKPEAAPAAAPAGAPAGTACFSVPVAIKKGEKEAVEVSAYFTGVMAPNPAKMSQDERQFMEYEDTLWLLSPYKIDGQTTTALLPTSLVLSYHPKASGSHRGSKVTWEGLGAAEPWKTSPLRVHFHHDKPFKKITKVVREIEVSHWGNIYVEEKYEVINAGTVHKGPFSRLRLAMQNVAKANSFQELYSHLPPSAHSLYYRDLIGNISTSGVRKSAKEVFYEVSLRYPLMGGWKADFTMGYSLPLSGFLFGRPKGRTRLIMDVSSPFDEVVIEELETRVVLPEGSADIKYTLPFDMEVSFDKKFTYLDTAGRPVLVLRKSNVIPVHNKPFAVDYSFGTIALLREPLLLIAVFASFFFAVAVYYRMEFTISKDDAWLAARTREAAAATLTRLSALWDDEAEALEKVAGVTDALADAVGIDAANAARHAAEARLRALDAQAKPLFEELERVSGKAAAAAREHADKGKALQQRVFKLVTEKAELLRKGAGAAEAGKRIAPAVKALQDARVEWVAAGVALCE